MGNKNGRKSPAVKMAERNNMDNSEILFSSAKNIVSTLQMEISLIL